MAYNKNTNWANEKKYLDNLSKNGDAGQKAWAENQKKVLASAEAQYGGSSSGSSGGGTSSGTLGGSSGGSKGGTSGGSSGSTNSQYTAKGSYFDAGLPSYAASQIKYLQDLYTTSKANGDMDAANKAHADAEAIRAQYGYSGGGDGSAFIYLPQEQFQFEEPQPTYENKYDPEIDRLLSQILNRDAFSYNVEEDPLFQQYKQMYMREGDRAMRETMAEAAAGAGGMNTYAMTAASQANNYYNSMLNDKIPELYQAAYDKYLKDIDMKINDLGLLQRMDETQYNRYKDTMDNWYKDKNFAYGMYRDDIADSQWQQNFNYGVSRDNVADEQWNKTFDYNSDWDTKKWDYETSIYDKESAKEEVWKYIALGITPSAELLAKAGMSETDVALAVASVQAENNTTGKAKSGGSSYGGGNYTGGDDEGNQNEPTGDNYYTEIANACKELAEKGNEYGAASYAKEAYEAGYITKEQYSELLSVYNPLLQAVTKPTSIFSNALQYNPIK